jgi:hypothetical protein
MSIRPSRDATWLQRWAVYQNLTMRQGGDWEGMLKQRWAEA